MHVEVHVSMRVFQHPGNARRPPFEDCRRTRLACSMAKAKIRGSVAILTTDLE
jgi:hypothetical protein